MSIYATLWSLYFPRTGDDLPGCEWLMVTAQGVPPHIGCSAPGLGYENGDPYEAFLPPALPPAPLVRNLSAGGPTRGLPGRRRGSLSRATLVAS